MRISKLIAVWVLKSFGGCVKMLDVAPLWADHVVWIASAA
jgi:hypothetical protein